MSLFADKSASNQPAETVSFTFADVRIIRKWFQKALTTAWIFLYQSATCTSNFLSEVPFLRLLRADSPWQILHQWWLHPDYIWWTAYVKYYPEFEPCLFEKMFMNSIQCSWFEGKLLQVTSVFRIHKIPLNMSRSFLRFRHLVSLFQHCTDDHTLFIWNVMSAHDKEESRGLSRYPTF